LLGRPSVELDMHIDLIAGAPRACSVTVEVVATLKRCDDATIGSCGVLVGMEASVMIQMLLSLTGVERRERVAASAWVGER
jgi:hypothetical protein